jgi:ribosomal small subunit protein bTHX
VNAAQVSSSRRTDLAARGIGSILGAQSNQTEDARTHTMGRGDVKSRQGKIRRGSYGKRRPKPKVARAAKKSAGKAATPA